MLERRTRVLLADDHPMMLEGLRRLLEPEFEVVGEVREGGKLLEAAEALRPDLVITDISMPGMDGLEATRRLRKRLPEVRVVVLSFYAELYWVRAAFAAGACGYLTKTSAADEIELALREVLQGRFFVSPAVTGAALAAASEPPAPLLPPAIPLGEGPLTPRESDIVRLVGEGLGNKEIAQLLGVSVTTVRTHLSKVYGKLKPVSRVELALLASHSSPSARPRSRFSTAPT